MTQAPPQQISVIIPTHQRDDLLERAIRSAADQSLRPVEIIVVDDVPSANTRSVCKALHEELPLPVKYVENLGPTGAVPSRNLGASKTVGQFLAFLDDDDTWDTNYLAHSVDLIADRQLDVLVTALLNVDESGNSTDGKTPPKNWVESDFYLTNPGVLCSNVVISASAFAQVGGYDVGVHGSADKDLVMQVVKSGLKYGANQERLVNWHVHSSQWSNSDRRLLPGVIRFYRKYFFSMSPINHLRMWRKMIRLALSRSEAG